MTSIFYYFKTELGETKPMGSPKYVQYRVVDMYTHCTHAPVRNKIQHCFTTPSPLKIVIATTAFGLEMNCSNVRQIIHWGVPEDWEAYVQESGRGGRDGKFACALLFKNMRDLDARYVSKHMNEYCVGMPSQCRRLILYRLS